LTVRREAALLFALLALVAAGCGGDDETAETVPPAPELSLPGNEEAPTLDDLPGTTGTDGTDDGATPDAQTPGEAAPPSDGGGQDQGGQQPPSGGTPAPDDTPQNDTPPPAGSPAERFEQFCQENPGAC
jgi:hypothetical protein